MAAPHHMPGIRDRIPPASLSSSVLSSGAQLGADVHQDPAEHVATGAVGAPTPVVVRRAVLDDILIAGAKQNGEDAGVGGELGAHRAQHHVVLDLGPVRATRRGGLPAHVGRAARAGCLANERRVRRAGELLSLVVVLRRGPPVPIEVETVRREVGEAAVRLLVGAKEIDRHRPYQESTAPPHRGQATTTSYRRAVETVMPKALYRSCTRTAAGFAPAASLSSRRRQVSIITSSPGTPASITRKSTKPSLPRMTGSISSPRNRTTSAWFSGGKLRYRIAAYTCASCHARPVSNR